MGDAKIDGVEVKNGEESVPKIRGEGRAVRKLYEKCTQG